MKETSTEIELTDITEIRSNINNRNTTNYTLKSGILEYSMIGNIRCYWKDQAGKPRIYIGPTWAFSLPILLAAGFLLYFLIQILLNVTKVHIAFRILGFALIAFDLYNFFYTLLADPGIPTDLFEMMYLSN